MARTSLAEAGVGSLVLLGCGKMGGAMLEGWLKGGLTPAQVQVIDPYPSGWLKGRAAQGVTVNPVELAPATVAVIAVKPQMMAEAAPRLAVLAGQGPGTRTLSLSIAAGTPIATFEAMFGAGTPIIRAMPNTPAAVGRGIADLIGKVPCSTFTLYRIAAELFETEQISQPRRLPKRRPGRPLKPGCHNRSGIA